MSTPNHQENLAIVRQYIALFNEYPVDATRFKQFVAPEVVWQEMPNTFAPTGRSGTLEAMLTGLERGNEVLSGQQYTVHQAVAQGDMVALEIEWQGALAKALGPFAAGTELRASVGIFLQLKDGKIVSQHDYPCYHLWES
jgi:ketosteroid isomerase-like protein